MTDFLELEHPIGVSQYLRSASAGRRLNLQTMNQRPQAASELDDTESSIPQTGSSRSLLRKLRDFFPLQAPQLSGGSRLCSRRAKGSGQATATATDIQSSIFVDEGFVAKAPWGSGQLA